MKRTWLLAAGLGLALSLEAFAQTPGERGDASKDLTNCPPSTSRSTSGAASPDAKAVEKSAILPSAENHEDSAAPTVQRNGESATVSTDCPQDADQPRLPDQKN